MWRAVVAILAGLLPALAIALSMIGMGLMAWLTLTLLYANEWPLASVVAILLITFVVFAALEYMWLTTEGRESPSTAQAVSKTHVLTAVAALVLSAFLQLFDPAVGTGRGHRHRPSPSKRRRRVSTV